LETFAKDENLRKKNLLGKVITFAKISFNFATFGNVPDLVSWIRDVVLVRRIFSSGNPRGSGLWDGEGMGRGWKWGDQFTSNLGPRWTGSYAKEGFQVSKREWEGSKKGISRGK
jgi:hypothetical protein